MVPAYRGDMPLVGIGDMAEDISVHIQLLRPGARRRQKQQSQSSEHYAHQLLHPNSTQTIIRSESNFTKPEAIPMECIFPSIR